MTVVGQLFDCGVIDVSDGGMGDWLEISTRYHDLTNKLLH